MHGSAPACCFGRVQGLHAGEMSELLLLHLRMPPERRGLPSISSKKMMDGWHARASSKSKRS